jgi:hypothetical protein
VKLLDQLLYRSYHEVGQLSRYSGGLHAARPVFYSRKGQIIFTSTPPIGDCFSMYLILPAALDPGVYSASNGNDYHKQQNNVCGE